MKEEKMEMGSFYGQTDQHIKVNLLITIFMDLAPTRGLMGDNTKENGITIKCMVEECLLGQMVGNMMVNTMMIKSKDMVYLHGQMGEDMKENGIMESNME